MKINKKYAIIFWVLALICVSLFFYSMQYASQKNESTKSLKSYYLNFSNVVMVVEDVRYLDYQGKGWERTINNKTVFSIEPFKPIKPGDSIKLVFPQQTSIKGYWASSNSELIPRLTQKQIEKGIVLSSIKCENKQRDWGSEIAYTDYNLYGDYEPYLIIKIPDDPLLQGETIRAILKMNIITPFHSDWGEFTNKNDYIEKTIELHIFYTSEEQQFASYGLFEILCEFSFYGMFVFALSGLIAWQLLDFTKDINESNQNLIIKTKYSKDFHLNKISEIEVRKALDSFLIEIEGKFAAQIIYFENSIAIKKDGIKWMHIVAQPAQLTFFIYGTFDSIKIQKFQKISKNLKIKEEGIDIKIENIAQIQDLLNII
jgi:hypothetical protein